MIDAFRDLKVFNLPKAFISNLKIPKCTTAHFSLLNFIYIAW